MAHYERVKFQHPVHKATNDAAIIEVGDTITVKVQNDSGTLVDQDLTVTAVFDGGKGIEWDREAAGEDFRTSDIARVHAKHQYRCPERANYRALNVSVATSGISGFKIGGVTTAFTNGPYTAASNNADAAEMEAEINAYLNDPLSHATVVNDGSAYDVYIMNTNQIISGDLMDAASNVAFASF